MFVSPSEVLTRSLEDQIYVGKVVDNVDPDKLGRIKVRIIEVFGREDKIPDAALPWAIPMRPIGHGASVNLSSAKVPVIGSEVAVQFAKGSIYSPIYKFSPVMATNLVSDADENYPNTYAYLDPNMNAVIVKNTGELADKGNRLVIDNVNDTIDFQSFTGFKFHIANDGSFSIDAPADSDITIADLLTIFANVKIDGTLEVLENVTARKNVQVDQNVNADLNISAGEDVSDKTSSMQDMRDTYNQHTNPSNGSAPPPQQMV